MKCDHCGREINGITGLNELKNLMRHMTKHGIRLNTYQEAAEYRAKLEARDDELKVRLERLKADLSDGRYLSDGRCEKCKFDHDPKVECIT